MAKKIRGATGRQVFVYKIQVVRAKPQRLDKILASGVSKQIGGECSTNSRALREPKIRVNPRRE
jgi:hypothetical protein